MIDEQVRHEETLGRDGRIILNEQEASHVYQPIVGIPLAVRQGDQGPHFLADAVGAWAIECLQGKIFLIPLWPVAPHERLFHALWPLVSSLDGILFPASHPDWFCQWCQRETNPGPETWTIAWEMGIAQLATFLGMPILGIGEGAEKWNVALGGRCAASSSLTGSKPPSPPDTWERHLVRVRSGSTLAEWMHQAVAQQDQKPWELLFVPHRGLEKLAPGLGSCAQSDESTLAAFERRDAPFGLGFLARVDWGIDQAYGRLVFEAFLNAAQSFAPLRQKSSWDLARESICATVSERVAQGQPLVSSSLPTSGLSDSLLARAPSSSRLSERVVRSRQPTLEELRQLKRKRLKAAAG